MIGLFDCFVGLVDLYLLLCLIWVGCFVATIAFGGTWCGFVLLYAVVWLLI